MHQPVFVEVPVFVPVRAKPIAGVVMPLVGKPHRNSAAVKCPQLLDETIVEFLPPLASEEFDDCRPPLGKLSAIAPPAINGVGQSYLPRITRVPAIFREANLLNSGLSGEWRQGRTCCCSAHVCIMRPCALWRNPTNRVVKLFRLYRIESRSFTSASSAASSRIKPDRGLSRSSTA